MDLSIENAERPTENNNIESKSIAKNTVPTSEANVHAVENHIAPIANKKVVSTSMDAVIIANTNNAFKPNHDFEKGNAIGQSGQTTISQSMDFMPDFTNDDIRATKRSYEGDYGA
jgi:hypothetical protein